MESTKTPSATSSRCTAKAERVRLAAGALAFVASTACAPIPESVGLDVVAVTPADGSTGVSRTPELRIELSRPVGPRGINFGSVRIESGPRQFGVVARHDPFARVIYVTPRVVLDPGASYRLELEGISDVEGRSIEPTTVRFATGPDAIAPAPRVAGWAEARVVLDICAACHTGPEAPLGMDLSTAGSVQRTALGVPAVEVRTEDPVRNGAGSLLGLARIEPGAPERSYVIWKVLGDEHIVGDPMPPEVALTGEQARTLLDWIAAGAPTE